MSWISTTPSYMDYVHVICTACLNTDEDHILSTKQKKNIPKDLMTLKEAKDHSQYFRHQYNLYKLKNQYINRLDKINDILSPLNLKKYNSEIERLNKWIEDVEPQITISDEIIEIFEDKENE